MQGLPVCCRSTDAAGRVASLRQWPGPEAALEALNQPGLLKSLLLISDIDCGPLLAAVCPALSACKLGGSDGDDLSLSMLLFMRLIHMHRIQPHYRH